MVSALVIFIFYVIYLIIHFYLICISFIDMAFARDKVSCVIFNLLPIYADLIKRYMQIWTRPEERQWKMTTDHRPHIRKLGLRRVMSARAASRSGDVRRFRVPEKVNF